MSFNLVEVVSFVPDGQEHEETAGNGQGYASNNGDVVAHAYRLTRELVHYLKGSKDGEEIANQEGDSNPEATTNSTVLQTKIN